jgi:choloylglycine hydrolase
LAGSDASGDLGIIDYRKGKPLIHHGCQYQVMTTSPIYSEQLILNAS